MVTRCVSIRKRHAERWPRRRQSEQIGSAQTDQDHCRTLHGYRTADQPSPQLLFAYDNDYVYQLGEPHRRNWRTQLPRFSLMIRPSLHRSPETAKPSARCAVDCASCVSDIRHARRPSSPGCVVENDMRVSRYRWWRFDEQLVETDSDLACLEQALGNARQLSLGAIGRIRRPSRPVSLLSVVSRRACRCQP